MAVVPRSMFSKDGSLLLCHDKARHMHVIAEAAIVLSPTISPYEEQQPSNRVLIIDAMAMLQSIKKTPRMTNICHLKEAFVTRISRIFDEHDEVRVLFDRYIEDSLKAQTRAKRVTSSASYVIHNEMSNTTIPLKDLLSSSKTKSRLCELLAQALLQHFEGASKPVVVTYKLCLMVTR